MPLRPEVLQLGFVRQVTVAPYFAEAIRRISTGDSLSALYEDFPEEIAIS